MMTLILSSLVSLVTLGILLFRRSSPAKRQMPAALLGASAVESPVRLKLSTPPWFWWLLVILATLFAALAYQPRENKATNLSGRSALIWVDTTLSTVLARKEHQVDAKALADNLTSRGYRTFGLNSELSIMDKKVTNQIEISELNSANDVTVFLNKQFEKAPSALVRPLNPIEVANQLQQIEALKDGLPVLYAITDGQAETLQNLMTLKENFSAVELILVTPSSSLTGETVEIVPQELLSLWKSQTQVTSDFVRLNDTMAADIPAQARPHIFEETFLNNTVRFITAGSQERRNTLPMITACAASAMGPSELDPFVDLRTLAQFFSASFRVESCVDEEQRFEREQNDPWKFRSESVWVVPADEEVLNTLTQRMWLPYGVNLGADALVYVASSKLLSGESQLLTRSLIQLEEEGIQTQVLLTPPPPEEPISVNLSSQNGEKETVKTRLEPVYFSADNIPLGYKAQGLPIYYLRTTVALPNSELGRSSSWSHFWLEVAQNTKGEVLQFVKKEFLDFESLKNQFLDFEETQLISKLDEQTLQFVPFDFANLVPGLYRQKNGATVLVSIPKQERSSNYVSRVQFEETWSAEKSEILAADSQNQQREKRSVFTLFASVMALAAVFVLWISQKKNSKKPLTSLLLFAFFLVSHPSAQAQNPSSLFRNFFRGQLDQGNREIAVPYRISWCDASAPDSVFARYEELRGLLASRGTIELPKKLLTGRCTPGASEIWWAADVYSLPTKQLSEHVSLGGIFVLEGESSGDVPPQLQSLADPSIGLTWQSPPKRGTLYRSFYLLQSFDGCSDDKTKMLSLKKKANAHSPVAISTRARFLTASLGSDCFGADEDYRARSFVNMMYSFLATDYKEDQLQLPEILNRVRNLGLEP